MGKKVVLAVLDGVGLSEESFGNAVATANMPVFNRLREKYPNIAIKAHGTAVGLPSDGDMGNSEVGHNALGCGQIYSQGAKLVNESIETGRIFYSGAWQDVVRQVTKQNSTLHFIGLLSDGNVHSNISHLKAMIKQAKEEGIAQVRVHALLDGRDVPPTSGLTYISEMEEFFASLNDDSFNARFASGGGRQKITMDRYEADWGMVELGWQTHVLGAGRQFVSASEAYTILREETGEMDQDLDPFVIAEDGEPVGPVVDGDAVIFYNFRGDRALEISRAFEEDNFPHFERVRKPDVVYAGMLEYDGDLHIPTRYLVEPPAIEHTLSEYLIGAKMQQFAVSETQKYGHVTYFWNGNRSGYIDEEYETYLEIPSDRVQFNERPWMKSAEITDAVIEAVESDQYDFIRLNYPNGDMVGHTGDYRAVEISMEAVDLALERLLEACQKAGYILVVTADHGNADDMYQKRKSEDDPLVPKTSHSLNPVPFIIVSPTDQQVELKEGEFGLANVAATIVELLGLEAPEVWEESMLK